MTMKEYPLSETPGSFNLSKIEGAAQIIDRRALIDPKGRPSSETSMAFPALVGYCGWGRGTTICADAPETQASSTER